MTIEDLPGIVKIHIMEKIQQEFSFENSRIYVTELLYCLRKAYFQRKIGKPITFEHAWYIYRGNLFDDAWTSLFPKNQIRCTYRIPDRPIVIVGRADFIDADGAVADLKTHAGTRFLKQPKEEHVKQVVFYAWTNAISKARLYYIDFITCKVFEINNVEELSAEIIPELIGRAKYFVDCLLNGSPPEKAEGWMCRSCEYSEECRKC